MILSDALYDKDRFAEVSLSKKTKLLIDQKPEGDNRALMNRFLLEDAYPKAIRRHASSSARSVSWRPPRPWGSSLKSGSTKGRWLRALARCAGESTGARWSRSMPTDCCRKCHRTTSALCASRSRIEGHPRRRSTSETSSRASTTSRTFTGTKSRIPPTRLRPLPSPCSSHASARSCRKKSALLSP